MLPDGVLLAIANAAHAEGKLQRVFIEGGVKTPYELVEMFKKPGNLPVFVFNGTQCAGFGWLNGIAGNRAFAHFCMLDGAGETTLRAFKMLLGYWMSLGGNEPIFDTLIGIIPASNERAVSFAQAAGCVVVGVIPQMLRDVYAGDRADAVILYYSRLNHGLRRQEGRR